MKIWTLIKKDMILCPGWLLTGVLLAIVAPVYFKYTADLSELLLGPIFLLSAVLACNISISRVCYVEDNYETKRLLGAMPVLEPQFVFSRYIEGFVMSVCLLAVVVLEGLILNVSMPAQLVAAALFVGFAYEGLYLFFFYKWGTNVAQYSLIALFAIIAGVCLVIEKLDISLGHLSISVGTGVVFAGIGLVLYIAFALLSCKVYRSV